VLITWESCIGVFLHSTLLQLYPCYYGMHIIFFSHLLSTNHKCTQPCPPAAQKLKKIWSATIWCSRWAIATGRLPVELGCRFANVSLRVIDLVICKTLFDNKYIILWHWLFCIHFLYSICVNLIPRHTYYEYSVWVLKPGMTITMHTHTSFLIHFRWSTILSILSLTTTTSATTWIVIGGKGTVGISGNYSIMSSHQKN
jgi:hypothetical protein